MLTVIFASFLFIHFILYRHISKNVDIKKEKKLIKKKLKIKEKKLRILSNLL